MSLRKASYPKGLARRTTCRATMQECKALGFPGITGEVEMSHDTTALVSSDLKSSIRAAHLV